MSIRASEGNRRSRIDEGDTPYDSSGRNARRVYVGNLAFEVKWQDLKDHMKQVGNVVRADVMEGRDGRSKGCGIVEFSAAWEAQRAIEELHDTELKGRLIFVREDRGEERPPRAAPGDERSPRFEMRQDMREGPPALSMLATSRNVTIGSRSDEPSWGDRSVTRQDMPPIATSLRVFVGNLSYETTWQSLKDHMKRVGGVVRANILEDSTGKSKGCGIVEFADYRTVESAIVNLNDSVLDGRMIFIREDREAPIEASGRRDAAPAYRERGGRDGGARSDERAELVGKRLYVGNLAYTVAWQDLKDHFKAVAPVVRANILAGPDGKSKGCGIVEFESPSGATEALYRLNNTTINGRVIHVREDREEKY